MFKRSILILGIGLFLLMAISAGTITAVIKIHEVQPIPTMTPFPDPIATPTSSITPTASPTAAASPTSSVTPQPEIPKATAKPTPPA
jgi:hypothetical protein